MQKDNYIDMRSSGSIKYCRLWTSKKDEVVNTDESAASQQESSAQTVESTDSEMTAEELLDLFINGSISAIRSTDLTSAFYITDLNMNSEEWDSYSVGEKVCPFFSKIFLDI